ncbi:MAG: hypothetical protein ACFFHD_10920 [Promethearchaeota archaeon]
MPKGLIVMKYDDRSGIDRKASFPQEELDINSRTLMNIFSLHEFSKQAGIASLTVGDINIVTYYTGVDLDYFIILILNVLENPEDYEEDLQEISQTILENLDDDKYIKMIPSFYKQIAEHTKKKKRTNFKI